MRPKFKSNDTLTLNGQNQKNESPYVKSQLYSVMRTAIIMIVAKFELSIASRYEQRLIR